MTLVYRDVQDEEAPPEFTALIRIHEAASASGVAETAELALDYALRDLKKTLRNSVRLLTELQRGRDPDLG